MNSNKLVYVVVLAWNHVEDTIECLESIMASDYDPFKVLLVDNASTDNTIDIVSNRFSEVEIVRSDKNLGVSGGYNLGMRVAYEKGADYLLIANNDISIHPKMISHLVDALEKHPQAGMGMPKIFHYYGDRSRLWCAGAYWRKFPPTVKMLGYNVRDSEEYSKIKEIAYAPSCCLILRREAIEVAGYFDTAYFFYFDDWDYSSRINRAGFKILFVPDAIMWHKVSISTQKSDKPAQWWTYYGRSTVRYYIKYSNGFQLNLFSLWFIIRECLQGNFKRIHPFIIGIKTEKDLYMNKSQ
jgi:GT2 family glycosyltransferase